MPSWKFYWRAFGLMGWLAMVAAAGAQEPVSFNRDVRPILTANCFACHGPDENSLKADLRLDKREVAIESEAIVPGKPNESGLVDRVFSTDPDSVMAARFGPFARRSSKTSFETMDCRRCKV